VRESTPAALREMESTLTSSKLPNGQRDYIRRTRLEDLEEPDLYSALLYAASDSIDAALSPAQRSIAAARKKAAMVEIETRETPPPRRTSSTTGSRRQALLNTR
jgi:hypothetical protein